MLFSDLWTWRLINYVCKITSWWQCVTGNVNIVLLWLSHDRSHLRYTTDGHFCNTNISWSTNLFCICLHFKFIILMGLVVLGMITTDTAICANCYQNINKPEQKKVMVIASLYTMGLNLHTFARRSRSYIYWLKTNMIFCNGNLFFVNSNINKRHLLILNTFW